MPPHRPVALLVMAILNFLVAGIGLFQFFCCGLGVACLGTFGNLHVRSTRTVLPAFEMGDPVFVSIPGYIPYLVFSEVMELVMAMLLVAGGIGLLSVKRWARAACLVYAGLTIFASVGGLIYMVAVVNPAMREKYGSLGSAPSTVGKSDITAIMWFGLGLVYAVALLVVLSLSHVRAAFAKRPTDPAADQAADSHPGRVRRQPGQFRQSPR